MDKLPQFNEKQLKYLQDRDFLLTKRKISQQLQQLLAVTEQTLANWVKENNPDTLPPNCLKAAGKISRGENYRGLPYLVLDYPRLFSRQEVFAFRSMGWWGNFFSCTLHLQGEVLEAYRAQLGQALSTNQLSPNNTWLCVHSTPWEYHYGSDNYQLLENLSREEIFRITEKSFVKISRKMPLENYKELPAFALQCMEDFLEVLGSRK